MEELDKVFQSYNKGYERARALYDEDDLEGAVNMADSMLEDENLPRYHKIKYILLIAACTEEWYETESLLCRAEKLCGIAEGLFQGELVDKVLAEFRGTINSLRSQYQEELRQKEEEWRKQHPEKDMDVDVEDEEDEEDEDEEDEEDDTAMEDVAGPSSKNPLEVAKSVRLPFRSPPIIKTGERGVD